MAHPCRPSINYTEALASQHCYRARSLLVDNNFSHVLATSGITHRTCVVIVISMSARCGLVTRVCAGASSNCLSVKFPCTVYTDAVEACWSLLQLQIRLCQLTSFTDAVCHVPSSLLCNIS